PKVKISLDANGAWAVNEAPRNLAGLDECRIDFIEQPVVQDPVANMQEVRNRCSMAVSANERIWPPEDTLRRCRLAPLMFIASVHLHRLSGAVSTLVLAGALSWSPDLPGTLTGNSALPRLPVI